MPRRTFFFITYLLGNVFSRLRGLTGHEVVRNKRPNDDGPLKRGGPLDVAAVKVDRDQNLYQEDLYKTSGLGHTRILHNEEVIRESFLFATMSEV